MKKTLMLATIGSALLLAGCVAVPAYGPAYAPDYEAAYAPPPGAYVAPPVVVAPPTVVVQPYLAAHWGHYYRGPYYHR